MRLVYKVVLYSSYIVFIYEDIDYIKRDLACGCYMRTSYLFYRQVDSSEP